MQTEHQTILPTENQGWGFYGTMQEDAAAAWPVAFAAVLEATDADAESVRAFLDSASGRHFADSVRSDMHFGATLSEAIESAVGLWMRWQIGRADSRRHGIPMHMPYLVGYVIHEGMMAEVA